MLCGYSLLPVDQRACDLLLKAPKKETRITIISGDQNERIASDFRTAGFHSVLETLCARLLGSGHTSVYDGFNETMFRVTFRWRRS